MSLQDIRRLEHRATELADRIGKKLSEGSGPTALLEDIQEQMEIVTLLEVEIQDLAKAPEGRLSADSLDRLKATLKTLVERVDANVQAAGQKGVRITPQAHPVKKAT